MADYFVVIHENGPSYDPSRPRREQTGWDDHAAFMDALVDDGVVVLGGPLGDIDGDEAMLIVDLPDEASVRARLAGDPWAGTILRIASIQPWTVWLRGPAFRAG